MRKRKVFALIALAAIVAMFVAACGDDDSSSSDTTATAPEGPAIKLRGQDFSESATIAQVYGQYLKAKGYDVNILTPAGFRTEAIDGLKNEQPGHDRRLHRRRPGGSAPPRTPPRPTRPR